MLFLKGIISKVNVLVRQEFELAYNYQEEKL